MTNPEPWFPSVVKQGDWRESQSTAGYFKENYAYSPVGTGNDWFKWIFQIPVADNYRVAARWCSASSRPTNAPYTVNHSSGSTTVRVSQRVNGGLWNDLGEFYFEPGEYSVVLTDDANSGNVIADAVRISHEDDPPEILQSDFYATVRSGVAPLTVTFSSAGTGDITGYYWSFGDGATNSTRDYIDHTYTNPGTYTVSHRVSGPLGTNTRTKTSYITVGSAIPPLQAEFSASSRTGSIPRSVRFRDRSTGNIVSWLWDFGDGSTSNEQSPTYVYTQVGNRTVSLTITDTNGNTRTETKNNFVRAYVFEKSVDNVDYPKTHFRSKTVLFRKEMEVPKEQLKYSRLFYTGCDSGHYYAETFQRGIMFYTMNSSGEEKAVNRYLKAYLEGKSDEELWEILQNIEPLYDYYNFDKTPSDQ
jgi:PKD repeat protein